MADDHEWYWLDEDTLPPLKRLLPDDVYQALPVSYTHLTLPTNREV